MIEPLIAFIVSLVLLLLLLYKRVNVGIALNASALFLALLALDWQKIPEIIYFTAIERLAVAVVLATFGIMLLSQLYKETGVINSLSESAGRIIRNSKIVSSVLPAIIGLLPVAGGALMSAPLVDSQTEKLGLKPEKKAYVNIWFRHTIFPVYPLSQVLIMTSALTGIVMTSIIVRQIPVVAVMVITGFLIAFWRSSGEKKGGDQSTVKGNLSFNSGLKRFLIAFSPILATIITVVGLGAAGVDMAGLDVFASTVLGIIVLVAIAKPSLKILVKPLRKREIYGVTLAAFGAFLLRNVAVAAGISEIVKTFAINGNIDAIVLLAVVPALLGFVTGSPSSGVAISVPILLGVVAFSPASVALLYISAFLGYLIVPSHLCLVFTIDYFKCSMGRVYRYILPSFIVSFIAAVLVYCLV